MNTTDFLSIASAICPERNCIVFENKRWTYAQLNDRVDRLCNALADRGVVKGDRIGILSVNCNEYIELYFASAKLGAIFVPLNFRAKPDELSYLINHADISVLFTGKRYLDMVDRMLPDIANVGLHVAIGGENGLCYEELMATGSAESYFSDIDTGDVTVLMYTSGTTGRPKGVPLRHSGFASYILENVEPANPDQEERNLLTVPLYHVAGVQAMLAGVYGGRTLILLPQFEVKTWLETVQREQATRAMLVPTMLKRVIEDPDFNRYDLSSLKVITYGAAAMPFDVITRAIDLMPGVRFINAFGQTETASTITVLGPEDHRIEGTEAERQKKLNRLKSSIGKPLPDVEVKIVDLDGKALGSGEAGEILVRGARIMSGYWEDPKASSGKVTKEGWLHTGDLGYMDEDGYLYLKGRADDMLIRGGENVSPREVEAVLMTHPKVHEAAVIGVSDPEWGQEIRAVVILKKGESATPEEIIDYCRPRMAGYKRPRSLIFVEEFPRNAMGKLLRKQISEQYGRHDYAE